MKYGISSFVWASPFSDSTLGLLQKARDMGFDLFEICVEDPETIHPEKIRPALHNADMKALICGAFGPERDISSDDPIVRRQGVAYIKQCVDIAEKLDSPLVSGPMYSATGKARLLSADAKRAQWAWAVENMRECAAHADQKNVRLAVEPLNRFETDFINTVAQGMNFLSDIGADNVGLLLDTFHLNIEESNIANAIRAAGDKLFHFHACSNTRGTPGEDHFDWIAIRDALLNIGYSGFYVIESFTTEIVEIAKAVSLWRPLAASQDDLAGNGLSFLKSVFENR